MRRIQPVSAVFLASMLANGAVAGADLKAMKLLQDEQGTRAVLELQGAGEHKLFRLQNPDRLVLDLSQARLAPGFNLPPANGAIASVRTGNPTPGTLRIVFDTAAPVVSSSRVERDGSVTRLVVQMATDAAGTASSAVAPPSNALPGVAQPPEAPATIEQVIASVPLASPFPPPPAVSPSQQMPASTLPAPRQPSGPVLAHASSTVTAPRPSSPAGNVAPEPRQFDAPAASQASATAALVAPVKTLRDVVGNGQRKLVVAIDAGHGGKDPGALGPSGVREKNVTLAVARELARQINADPGMRAVLIRDGDSFVQLKQRYMKARAAQADLFISIHADASPNNTASGASVFVLSTRGASSQAARWLADQENAADLVGGVSLDQKDHNLAAVLLDLSQSATMRASDDIANQVLGSLKSVGKAHKPSLERANFVVLRSPDVPSMLIETGFITNPTEEQRLNDAGYRTRLAAAITEGVRRYFTGQPPAGSFYASRDDLRPSSRTHVVGRGETLGLIAARHGVAVESIREANRRRDDALRVGESLTIPLMAASSIR